MTLLELDRLGVSFRTEPRDLHALDGISFAVNRRRVHRHRRRIRLRQDDHRARDPAYPPE